MKSGNPIHIALLTAAAIVLCWSGWTDMACALVGAICALLFLSAFHNRAIQKINFEKEPAR
jgi:uncharacterized membrane protein YjdF